MKRYHRLIAAIITLLAVIVTSSASIRVDGLVFTRIGTRDGLSDNEVLHLLQLHDGRMAVTTSGNVNIYNGGGFDYVHYVDSSMYRLADYDGAYHVYAGRDNRLWIKERHNMQCLDVNRMGYVNDLEGMFTTMKPSGGRVNDLFLDRRSDIWLVDSAGLWDVERQRHLPLVKESGNLQDLEVTGDTVMLFYSTGLVRGLDRNTSATLFESRAYGDDIAGKFRGSSLVRYSPDGKIYQIRTNFGNSILLQFDPRTLSWREIMRTPYILHTLAMTPHGDLLITSQGGLWHVDRHSLEPRLIEGIKTPDGPIKTDNFNTIFIDNHGGVWIGTYHSGLLYSHPLRFRMHSSEERPEMLPTTFSFGERHGTALRINDTITDSRGWLWSATSDGLKVTRNTGDSVILYTENGLVNNNVKSLVEAADGTMWTGTAYGISSVRPESDGGFTVRSFDINDGALSDEYIQQRALRLDNGFLVFQGQNGWTVFHPDSMSVEPDTFNPVFTRFTANNRRIDIYPGATVTLPFHDNNLSLDIASLNYARPMMTTFKVRILTDIDNDAPWTVYSASDDNGIVDRNGFMHLKFMNQPPGRYTVQVAAATDASTLDDAPVNSLQFVITPPWWLTRGAIIVYILVAIALIVASFAIYQHITRNRLKRKHREEMLLMRIHNLIERCDSYERGQADRAADDKPEPDPECSVTGSEEAEPAISPQDREFIAKAINFVEANIGERGFSVKQLSEKLCMERTGLYKKMTFLLDKSPSSFIRSIRLNHAAAMVKEGRLTMAEIADRTGFSSTSHMSRCFVEEYGCKPSEYAQRAARNQQQP